MSEFNDNLAITLTLTIKGKAYAIPAGNVKSLELELQPYGYRGKISFVVSAELSADKLFAAFTQDDLISVSLTVTLYNELIAVGGITSLALSGLATTRGFSEQTLTNVLKTQGMMLYRHYRLEFADPAQVLWTQHYPCDLFTNTTLQALITAHAPAEIQLTYDWSVLQTQYPMLALSLGSSGNRASFYDFIWWLADTQNGVFSYDTGKNQYTLSAAKSQDGDALSLVPDEIAGFGMDYAEICRYQPNVLNAYSKNPQTAAIDNAQKVTGVRRDFIQSYPIDADKQARVTLETARLKQPLHEVWVDYQRFPALVAPPGRKVDFKGSSAWNKSIFVQANTYRVKQWRLLAVAVSQNLIDDTNNAYGLYRIEHGLRLECIEDPRVAMPSYETPVYPVFVEGKIDSEKGEDTDATYQFYTDQNTSVNYYQTIIPLWNNQKIRVAYQPNLDGGQFYFPPYKTARVRVGLNLDNAYIDAFLDWGAGTALPLDSQGNQLVMGKSATSQNIIKHSYVDSKTKLEIQRTEDKDTELLQFSDGYIVLQTKQAQEGG